MRDLIWVIRDWRRHAAVEPALHAGHEGRRLYEGHAMTLLIVLAIITYGLAYGVLAS